MILLCLEEIIKIKERKVLLIIFKIFSIDPYVLIVNVNRIFLKSICLLITKNIQ